MVLGKLRITAVTWSQRLTDTNNRQVSRWHTRLLETRVKQSHWEDKDHKWQGI